MSRYWGMIKTLKWVPIVSLLKMPKQKKKVISHYIFHQIDYFECAIREYFFPHRFCQTSGCKGQYFFPSLISIWCYRKIIKKMQHKKDGRTCSVKWKKKLCNHCCKNIKKARPRSSSHTKSMCNRSWKWI